MSITDIQKNCKEYESQVEHFRQNIRHLTRFQAVYGTYKPANGDYLPKTYGACVVHAPGAMILNSIGENKNDEIAKLNRYKDDYASISKPLKKRLISQNVVFIIGILLTFVFFILFLWFMPAYEGHPAYRIISSVAAGAAFVVGNMSMICSSEYWKTHSDVEKACRDMNEVISRIDDLIKNYDKKVKALSELKDGEEIKCSMDLEAELEKCRSLTGEKTAEPAEQKDPDNGSIKWYVVTAVMIILHFALICFINKDVFLAKKSDAENHLFPLGDIDEVIVIILSIIAFVLIMALLFGFAAMIYALLGEDEKLLKRFLSTYKVSYPVAILLLLELFFETVFVSVLAFMEFLIFWAVILAIGGLVIYLICLLIEAYSD